jgi:hypothetical protein
MAFSPFHSFRKHQKVVFAGLTIICMLTFVMAGGSFAGGDFFSELTRLITGGRSRIPEVAMVYGKKVSDREIQELRQQRRLANDFMLQAVSYARFNIIDNVRKYLSPPDKPSDLQFDQADQNQLQSILLHAQLAAFNPNEYLNNLQIYLMQLRIIDSHLVEAKKPQELVNALRQLEAVLYNDIWVFRTPKDALYPDENLYFGGSMSEKGLLDFLIWRHQADRLGIRLTTADIAKQFGKETLEVLPKGSAAQILRQVLGGGQPSRNMDQTLLTALGDEFRVRMAQAALVGYDPGGHVGQVPTSITPYEFWENYKTNRTELSLKLLPVPVQKFLPEVKEQPKEDELEALFNKYKDEEYAPDKDTPGFKQPRRLKIEWLSASADSPYYRKLAQQCILSQVVAAPGNPYVPLNVLWSLASEYQNQKWLHFRAPALTVPDFAYAFYDYRYLRGPENVAATVGQALGMAGTQGSVFATLAAFQCAAVARTQKEVAPIVAREAQRRPSWSGVISAAGRGIQPTMAWPGTLQLGWDLITGIEQYASKTDQYLPMDLVKGQLLQKVQENVANTLLTESFKAFKDQLDTLGKEVERKKIKLADAEKQVEKAIAEHGWAHGAMTELRDQYEINRNAPGLAPLKEAYMRSSQFGDAKGKSFAQKMFFGQPADKWKNFSARELYASPVAASGQRKTFLYWKTDDKPAQVFKNLAQARSQVVEAWRLEKARALAKAKVEELAKQAREAHGDYLPILNEAAKHYAPIFDLAGVARWVKPPLSSRADPFAAYQRYAVPDDKIEYPPAWPNFVDPLLESLHEPGDTTVIANRPKDIYYVVALAGRNPPSVQDFYKETGRNRDLLLVEMERERQKRYREQFVAQLENEANLTINPEGLERVKERPNLRDD